jgi:hypothetical protein
MTCCSKADLVLYSAASKVATILAQTGWYVYVPLFLCESIRCESRRLASTSVRKHLYFAIGSSA